MSKYAIIQLVGKQFKISEGEKITVDRLETEEGKSLDVTDVLLVNDDKSLKIGEPLVKGAKVSLKVLENHKGKKIRVAKFKAKSRYRKVRGHRQHLSTLEVVKISA